MRQIRGLRERGVAQRPVPGLLIPAGLIAAVVLAISGAGGEDEASAAGCNESSATADPAQAGAGDHPDKRFYGPDETIPGADFAHVLSDGYVVITYRNDLRPEAGASLRRWILSERTAVVAGAFDGQAEAIRAVTARSELRCQQLHLESLSRFRDDWFGEVRS